MHDKPSAGGKGRTRRWWPAPEPTHIYPRVTSARVLAAMFDIAVGLRLLWPDNILGNPQIQAYRLLNAHFHGDAPLGLGLLVFGAVMLAGLYTDRCSRLVGAATWLSMLTWIVVAIDIALVTLSQLATVSYILVVALNAYAYAHLVEWRQQQARRARGGSRP